MEGEKLFEACGDEKSVEDMTAILEANPNLDINWKDPDLRTALHRACYWNQVKKVTFHSIN